MPEEIITTNLHQNLALLEDNTLKKQTKCRYYYALQNILQSETQISNVEIERLLAVCLYDLQISKQLYNNILPIIKAVTKRIKDENLPTPKNLFEIMLAILNIIKTTSISAATEIYRDLCFETVLSFPDSILIEVVTSNAVTIVEIIDVFFHKDVGCEIQILPCELILKLLNVTPKEKRITFVKDNLKVWFTKVIPTSADILKIESLNLMPLYTLEALTDCLVHIDYSENPFWLNVLECIYNPQKYPLAMKEMLENGSKTWHRLWIVFIRLLKNQITRSNNPIGSPINSMLPVVEMAFKMDVANRCRAFQCWNVLIDNFHTETSEVYIVKRLKLLIIPLKSNNAKVEKTALAKLNTWWYLIYRFQNRLEKFVDAILISFLHFCFGKHVPQKQSFVPGLLTNSTKLKAVQAFIEMAGHLCCIGCVVPKLPKLSCRIISKKILVDYWNDWVYSLKMVICIASEDIGVTQQQITCVWKSFVLIISEMPDNNVRKDLFDELLAVLDTVLQDGHLSFIHGPNVVINLTGSLFDNDKIKPLLKAKSEKDGPLIKIMSLLLKPTFNVYYRSEHTKDVILKLKLITKSVTDGTICSPGEIIKWMLLSPNVPQDNISYLWTALSESLLEQQCDNITNLDTLLLWPLKSSNSFADVSYSSFIWYRLFEYIYTKLDESVTKNISSLSWSNETTNCNILLKLYASIVILKWTLAKDCVPDYDKQVELLMEVTNRIEDYKQIENISPMLIEVIVNVLKKDILLSSKVRLSKNIMKCVKNVLKLMTTAFEKNDVLENYSSILDNLFIHLDKCLQIKALSVYTLIVTDELVKLSILLDKWPLTKQSLLSVLKTCLLNINEENRAFNDIKKAIDNMESNNETTNKVDDKSLTGNKFNTPDLKIITRKAKKKEVGIVSTVVENGEEFIVVKSNWKFNPRKLTENQKEKFQRKREDIPALYQDLSQSQDEFKIKSWKADSQDASSTNSKSTTASKSSNVEDVTNVLKNIPSSDVVPKIIENMFSDNVKKIETEIFTAINPPTASPNSLKQMSTTKDIKSPRMALKDRVFKNVKNLIEKSSGQRENEDLSESLTQFENTPKTPISKTINNVNLINSAPPVINVERPTRVKRKPKKFDDVELFALKRSRRSLSQSDSSPDTIEQNIQSDMKETCTENDGNVPSDKPDKKSLSKSSTDSSTNKNIKEKNELLTAELEAFVKDVVLSDHSCVKDAGNTEQKENNSDVEKDNAVVVVENKSVMDEVTSNKITDLFKNVEVTDNTNSKEQLKKDSKEIIQEVPTEENSKTPKTKKHEPAYQKSSAKKESVKKSRIEKELAIDTVEGHPFLKIHSEKRVTRKNVINKILSGNNTRRRSLTDKLNKSKSDTKGSSKTVTPNMKKKDKERTSSELDTVPKTVGESQEASQNMSDTPNDFPLSEDIIESSQDSTFTTITATSTKNLTKKLTVVLEKVPHKEITPASTNLLNNADFSNESSNNHTNQDNNDDSDFPQNKTASVDNTNIEATEDMETEPMNDKIIDLNENSSDVIIINDDEETPIVINTEDTAVGSETQEIAEADTLPTDPINFVESKIMEDKVVDENVMSNDQEIVESKKESAETSQEIYTADDITETICEPLDASTKTDDELNTASSPFKDEEQRKKDFLDNTLEISPIKTMSPERNKKSPSPETSSDYVVIKLSSPVQSNGEPFEKCDSPEIFTEDKVSPDKRELSPPREESSVNNTGSPSSSLSLKKNRPQVRSGGRAAQMLGLCVPERLQSIINSDRTEAEEPKQNSPSTPARRNLRILYSSVVDTTENSEDNEDSENFLKFKKSLPASDCSPSVPILKRKLVEITDEATISPASKRKRVSFHDPPVSTTIAVQKYIEPLGIRSPQNSALKRLERQNQRPQTALKSSKRLDNVFKLDSVLIKAVESFTDVNRTSTDDTQSMSLDETPAVEIFKNSDLNDTDPICLELIDCKDPIDNIAGDLSSPTMKLVFLKELEGKIATVGDLAKMTELEVNRLCIKAPKVKIAKKVLDEYAAKNVVEQSIPTETVGETIEDGISLEVTCTTKMDVESQTNDIVSAHTETQTDAPTPVEMAISHSGVQTEESGEKSTKDIIAACIAEKPDFVELLGNHLEESSKLQIAETLPFDTLTDAFMKKVTNINSKTLLTRIIEKQNEPGLTDKQRELTFLQDYFCDRFDSRDLILFCSRMLAKIHDKPF